MFMVGYSHSLHTGTSHVERAAPSSWFRHLSRNTAPHLLQHAPEHAPGSRVLCLGLLKPEPLDHALGKLPGPGPLQGRNPMGAAGHQAERGVRSTCACYAEAGQPLGSECTRRAGTLAKSCKPGT